MRAQNARGTRDFSPIEIKKRNYIINTIRKHFERYAFLPIETPAIENLSTLIGKYGEEGDQLLFKILNSRLNEHKNKHALKQEFEKILEKPYSSELITERALRYDLTVPFARYVSQYRHNIVFPFKRYQIQPVWRADKPQKSRYREFVQCDADIIGTNSLFVEAELIMLIDDVFSELKLPVTLKINNRKIIAGIIEHTSSQNFFNEIVVFIDKLDKADEEEIKNEMQSMGLSTKQIDEIFRLISSGRSNNFEKLEELRAVNNPLLNKGIEEVSYLLEFYKEKKLNIQLELDTKLARGLNYYTGNIFEAKSNIKGFPSSILGGGRYDDLTSIFDLPNISGVGISFGIDRIYDIMQESNLFPPEFDNAPPADILLIFMDEHLVQYTFEIAHLLRHNDIRVEVYHQKEKLKKCLEYASKKGFSYVGIVGESEKQNQKIAIKNLKTGHQEEKSITQIIELIKSQK